MHKHVLIGLVAVMTAAGASARTVYDAGKALRQNCVGGGYANPYTDQNGGVWSYRLSNENANTNSSPALAYGTYTYFGKTLAGFALDNTKQASSIRVNISGSSISTGSAGSEPVEPDELIMFPANSEYQWAHVRFTVRQAGWYSAFVSAHDIVKEATASESSGVKVRLRVNDVTQVDGIVSIEDYSTANNTHRFDFQMPVRYVAANDTIDLLVGRNGANAGDNTGVKFIVTKEDDGAFYDSGVALSENLATVNTNPYGTDKNGTWYFLTTAVPSSSVDFSTWAPSEFDHYVSRLTYFGARSDGLKGLGVANNGTIKSPYIVVNDKSSYSASMAPCELQIHPNGSDAKSWTALRFRPPVSGRYSASVVARDVNKGGEGSNGVDVYLLVAERVVASSYISAETFASTAHLVFESRLVAAGEPVDIVVSPHGQPSSDATGISAIFRREDARVYDAAKSFIDKQKRGDWSHPFADAIGGGAIWDLGAKTNAWSGDQFYPIPINDHFVNPYGNRLGWHVHAVNNDAKTPRFAMATNGIASVDSQYITTSPLLATIPYEFVVQPNTPGYQSSSPTLQATVPSNGLYCVRGYARDLNNNTSNGDGVLASIVADGHVVSSSVVSRDSATTLYEAAIGADRLWLKAGETLEFVVDPREGNASDATGFTACYDFSASATAHVVNVDIAGAGEGKSLRYSERGREGWRDWNRWNALRPSGLSSASVEDCREADGVTKSNVGVTLTRGSGSASVVGSGSSSVLDNYVQSSGTSDLYTFTISSLKANEPYTLYLYSAKGGASGNATFTVGGVAKGVEESWSLGATKMLTRFEVKSDANGVITGTFAAADGNGGALNGLTVVGDFPAYKPRGTMLVIR